MNGRGATRIIAHRGASGYLPEHTLEAKCLAYGMGADFLEQDIVATRDGVPVVLHDITLDDVSDVAARFPSRRRRDGHWYVIDFDFDELRQLCLRERRRPGESEPLYSNRFPFDLETFRIASFAEELRLVRGLNATTGRAVGVYPEIKAPDWHLEQGIDVGRALLGELERSGIADSGAPVFIQCFDADELERIDRLGGGRWALVQLLDENEARRLEGEPAAVAGMAERVAGVGLPYRCLIGGDGAAAGRPTSPAPLLSMLRAAGLEVHPYTFRRETVEPEYDFSKLLRYFIVSLEVEALFCDQPDIAVGIRREAV